MPKERTRKYNQIKRIEGVEAELDQINEVMKAIDVPMVRILAKHLLKGGQSGYNYKDAQKALKDKGYDVGVHKACSLIKAAKAQIVLAGEKDIAVNLGWAQANLMDMHREAVENGDPRQRFAVIQELIKLWGLHRPTETVSEQEITPEMIEQFEQRLLR